MAAISCFFSYSGVTMVVLFCTGDKKAMFVGLDVCGWKEVEYIKDKFS